MLPYIKAQSKSGLLLTQMWLLMQKRDGLKEKKIFDFKSYVLKCSWYLYK